DRTVTGVQTCALPISPNPPANLVVASLVGAAYLLASVAVVVYTLPPLWTTHITPHVRNNLLDYALWGTVEIAVAIALGWFGTSLAGANPPKGLRGGIFLMALAAVVIALVVRAVGLGTDGTGLEGTTGFVITAVVGAALVFGAY